MPEKEKEPSRPAMVAPTVEARAKSSQSTATKLEAAASDGEATTNEDTSATSAASGDSGGSSSNRQRGDRKGKAESPEKALANARTLQGRATSARKSGKPGSAFELASQAWQSVHDFPNDAQCQNLAQELAAELEEFGKEANAKVGSKASDSSKTLIEK